MDSQRTHLTDPVPWGVFYAVIGLIVTVFSLLFSSMNTKVAKADESRETILVQLSSIQTDLKNLDARLLELKADIKNSR